MGVDVNLYAEIEVTPEQLAQADEFYRVRSSLWDDYGNDGEAALAVDDGEWHEGHPRVFVRTWARYYGPGYERGPWPEIYGGIRVLQACFPDAKVFYGGDTDDKGVECTDDYLTEIWTHFLGPHGNDYRTRP